MTQNERTKPLTRNQREKKFSYPQLQTQQQAWGLYITEGYHANMMHAFAVNAYTLDAPTLRLMKKCIREAAENARLFRELMEQDVGKRVVKSMKQK